MSRRVPVFKLSTEDYWTAVQEGVGWLNRGLTQFVNPDELPGPGFYVMTEWSGAHELRRLTIKWSRTPATGVAQDAAMTTHHFLNITGGVPDATWTAGDYTAVEGAMDAWWTAVKPNYAPTIKLSEYNWRADGPAFRPHGTSLSPTLRITAKSVPGTSAVEGLPPQVAVTVTETTASTFIAEDVEGVGDQVRNRWGRFYMPAPSIGCVVDGRLATSVQNSMSSAIDTAYEACVSAQIIPVVYSPTTGHSWSILETHLDDIFDVIRSRRYVVPLARAAKTLTQL